MTRARVSRIVARFVELRALAGEGAKKVARGRRPISRAKKRARAQRKRAFVESARASLLTDLKAEAMQ